MDVTTLTTTALLAFAIVTAQNLIRYIKALNTTEGRNGVLGILLAWGFGFGIVWWAAQAALTARMVLVVDGPELGKMDVGSLLLLGLSVGSAGSQFVDWLKARDNTQSAAKPKLLNAPPVVVVAPVAPVDGPQPPPTPAEEAASRAPARALALDPMGDEPGHSHDNLRDT